MRNPRIINAEIVGIFNAADWLEEGDGLCISARITRATWLRKRRVFAQRIEASGASRRLWLELTGLPRASVLLLGYSIEMYLKAGLVKAYRGCREELFSHDLMRKFKHNLLKLASEIDFPNTQQNEQNFTELQELIKGGARYPITPEDVMGNDAKASRNRFSKQIRERNALIWSDDRFRQLCALSAEIRAYATRIDSDENNPSHLSSGDIGQAGYWSFRFGVNLRPRVTYRLCSSLPSVGAEDVKKVVERNPIFRALTTWEDCTIYPDKIK
jgi:hypothetical protein